MVRKSSRGITSGGSTVSSKRRTLFLQSWRNKKLWRMPRTQSIKSRIWRGWSNGSWTPKKKKIRRWWIGGSTNICQERRGQSFGVPPFGTTIHFQMLTCPMNPKRSCVLLFLRRLPWPSTNLLTRNGLISESDSSTTPTKRDYPGEKRWGRTFPRLVHHELQWPVPVWWVD